MSNLTPGELIEPEPLPRMALSTQMVSITLSSNLTPRKGDRVGIKEGWIRDLADLDRSTCADIAGTALGVPVFVEQEWLPVKWDDEDDPTFFKLAGIRRLPREKEASDVKQTGGPAQVVRAEAPVRKSRGGW